MVDVVILSRNTTTPKLAAMPNNQYSPTLTNCLSATIANMVATTNMEGLK